jgi:hypothetical protein
VRSFYFPESVVFLRKGKYIILEVEKMNSYALVNDHYIVTDDGRVFTYRKNHKKWREQKLRKNSNGYLRATIDGKDKYVHRLVAECFIDNPDGYKEVNHIDGDKTNNRVDNLEWCSRSWNNKHAFQTGLRDYKELSRMAKMPRYSRRKFTNEQVLEIRASKKSDTDLSKQYGVARGAIYQIRKRISYKEVV